uniref:zinc finger MYM-type protein 1-like n=1 Tax=Fragaria vesca subsp. vesca TaxID=101020 RepID=UPI0005C8FB6D|nr:PREDICTED: zinc finger MYM-type protein 1-like [Fragaria vesca subsp. vesca]
MEKWNLLRNLDTQIESVFVKRTTKEVEHNRFRLKAAIEAARLLANQGQAFRGHDESESSLNAGNFRQVRKSFERMASDDDRVVLENAPGNAKYTSPPVQKELLNILGNRVRQMIREEVGDAKFCILVDEAVDAAGKEQMSIVLRFVDRYGFIRERFFKIVSVPNTTSLTLKLEIVKVLGMFNLQVENMRGQGYDGASNMSGVWNGLQALFLEDCPYAYYVHCFAHRLQLALNGAAKGVHDTYRFFSTLLLVVNFVDSSAKRKGALKAAREDEIQDLIALGNLQTGTGSNQTCTLQRPATTRWSSHFRSIKSLIELFGSTMTILDHMMDTATLPIQGEASGILRAMRSFEFVFCLILMHRVMKVTEVLCQVVQRKSIDIGEAMKFVDHTKELLQYMRDDGWDDFLMVLASFCETHNIDMPDMSSRWLDGTGRPSQQKNFITHEHHFRVEVFNAVLDFQLSELNKRFNERSCELLTLTSTLDPHDKFSLFETQKEFAEAVDNETVINDFEALGPRRVKFS